MPDNWQDFWDKFDFDALVDFVLSGDIQEFVVHPIAIGIMVVLVGLMGYKKTRELGKDLTVKTGAVVLYGVCGVALKNSQISEIGPFILAIALFFLFIGYMVWTKMIRG